MQVIGSVFNDPKILEEQDKYIIREEDFTEEFHKIVFGAMYNIVVLGGSVNLETIVDYLSTRPKFYGVFQQNKGVEYITKASEFATRDTFNYYYTRLKKMTLLRAYDNYGVDVSFLYDPTNVLDTKKKQEQEEWLDNTSVKDIVNLIDERIDRIKSEYADEECGDGYQIGDGALELISQFEKCPEVGIPLYGPLINTVTRGARLKKYYLRSASTGTGKAIPNDTIIPTPIGDRRVGDIRPGDYLFGQNGKPVKVLQIHPQPQKKDVWKVTFIDGREALCCEDHLWEYRYYSHRGFAYRVESLKDILKRTEKLKNGLRGSDGKGFRFAIKINQPVKGYDLRYSVDPYVMGALIGDGSFRYNGTNKSLTFSSENAELPNRIAQLLGQDIFAYSYTDRNYSYVFKSQANPEHPLWVEEILKDYPDLWNCKSEDKFIPEDYLHGSIEQRYALLQGLMDTDGSISQVKGRVNFTTISPKLRDNVIALCRSLGFITTWQIDQREDKYTTGECYNVHIQCAKELKPKLFRLKRKVDIATEYANNGKRSEYKDHLSIISIEKLDYQTDMTCFTVDSLDHLFLMNDYIVTHNTRSMVADACNFASDEIYEPDFGMWIKNGKKEPTLFIATEQDITEMQTMAIAFLSDVNEAHILNGKYDEGERERVIKAAKKMQEIPLWVECIPDFSIADIENTIKRYIREHDVKYVCLDYLKTSMKILEEITRRSGGVRLREDNILFMFSVRLKDLCNQYGIFILSATQLNGDFRDAEVPDQNLLRGAKSIGDALDVGMILLEPTKDDLVKIEPIIASSPRFKVPNIKLSIYKNRRGSYKGVYLWCDADLGTCRIKPMFCTNYRHELKSIEDIKIMVDDEPSAF